MPEPVLSIIVPTRNRSVLLAKMLDSLVRLQVAPGEMEVIVADDGSSDNTLAELAKRRDPFALRVVPGGSTHGPSAARNRGVKEARGEVLGFLDSDVLVDPLWWQAARAHFQNPQTAAVEGATLPPAGSPRPTPFTHFVSNHRGGSYQTCNFLCRIGAFREAGGFDERFALQDARGKMWHVREDTDLAFSLLEQGVRIAFEPKAVVWHPLVPASPWVYWLETRFGFWEALLRRKHPRCYAQMLGRFDGRAFPVFYWGVYFGWACLLLSLGLGRVPWAALGALCLAGGWAGSIYLVCRKRQLNLAQVLILIPQFFVIPWLRLYWVLRGEWAFRHVHPRQRSV